MSDFPGELFTDLGARNGSALWKAAPSRRCSLTLSVKPRKRRAEVGSQRHRVPSLGNKKFAKRCEKGPHGQGGRTPSQANIVNLDCIAWEAGNDEISWVLTYTGPAPNRLRSATSECENRHATGGGPTSKKIVRFLAARKTPDRGCEPHRFNRSPAYERKISISKLTPKVRNLAKKNTLWGRSRCKQTKASSFFILLIIHLFFGL